MCGKLMYWISAKTLSQAVLYPSLTPSLGLDRMATRSGPSKRRTSGAGSRAFVASSRVRGLCWSFGGRRPRGNDSKATLCVVSEGCKNGLQVSVQKPLDCYWTSTERYVRHRLMRG